MLLYINHHKPFKNKRLIHKLDIANVKSILMKINLNLVLLKNHLSKFFLF